MNECRYPIERIKKEMRIEAHLKGGEAGLNEAGLGGKGAAFAVASSPRKCNRLAGGDDQRIEQTVERNVSHESDVAEMVVHPLLRDLGCGGVIILKDSPNWNSLLRSSRRAASAGDSSEIKKRPVTRA